ncbi:asparagine synthase (glutamine-hydrolyzing) [Pseudonocardia broussonetiae]|uniref:asparagine synthase (glutamine-hydrolyzing) n=1 Tax=Pseudonocardia broussonetiae TaxID=2736640 RepID=A0A6M6JEC3_9PSEU|nr:asparagine synthase (glutamine-hydrolyzing) [Pseudonocardia broussonetiae]QJY45453.1 asparagine synthase (glutamine-hydrolyzing) [Pseudonocardia broussonetiae]
MCGIVAAYGAVDPDKCERMLARLRHRGPDDTGVLAVDGAWLGHQRLSIIDVSGGHQPLTDLDETAWIVGNGEIYNHERLTSRLPDGVLRSRSDTEAALHAVLRGGPAAVATLDGMFAIAMATADGGGLVARDPMGVKPLYQVTDGGVTLFASELRAFDDEDRPRVEAFPPGSLWTPGAGVVRFADAVPVEVRPARRAQHDTWDDVVLDEVRDAVVAAVRRRMMSDVGVGVFLSGGLDSAIVAAIAAREVRERGEVLPTFAVGTAGSGDLVAAARVAEHIGSDHHEVVVTAAAVAEALDEAVTVIEHFDPALVRSAVPNLLLAREASKEVKVVLTGEGADELFAGYSYVHTDEFADPDALHAELVRSLEQLHGLNLQRCDRTTMFHGLEAREPFLDAALVRTALALPPEWKQRPGGRPEKALLREAFTGWLPEDLLWRGKEQFGDGSGAGAVLAALAAERVAGTDTGATPEVPAHCWPLRSDEEVLYFAIWSREFAGIRADATLQPFATA